MACYSYCCYSFADCCGKATCRINSNTIQYVQLMFIITPTNAQISRVKLILKFLRRVSVLIHHRQGVCKLCQLKLWIIKMMKCNTVKCRYDKILVIVAAYVILHWIIFYIMKYNKYITFWGKWWIISIDLMDLPWLDIIHNFPYNVIFFIIFYIIYCKIT